jgi:hypothetical protein
MDNWYNRILNILDVLKEQKSGVVEINVTINYPPIDDDDIDGEDNYEFIVLFDVGVLVGIEIDKIYEIPDNIKDSAVPQIKKILELKFEDMLKLYIQYSVDSGSNPLDDLKYLYDDCQGYNVNVDIEIVYIKGYDLDMQISWDGWTFKHFNKCTDCRECKCGGYREYTNDLDMILRISGPDLFS